jgi:hypothetical protein
MMEMTLVVAMLAQAFPHRPGASSPSPCSPSGPGAACR